MMFHAQVKIGIFNHGEPFRFYIHTEAYSQVKLSWIFLGVSLVSSAIIFPIFKFSPPRYGKLQSGKMSLLWGGPDPILKVWDGR